MLTHGGPAQQSINGTSHAAMNIGASKENENETSWLQVGGMVDVQSRTWPGINKPGGIGRVIKVHHVSVASSTSGEDKVRILSAVSPISHVDVKYLVMGGRERMIPLQYVNPAPEYETSPATNSQIPVAAKDKQKNLRDRSILLGRCQRCGSLRMDCGSCDWVEQRRLVVEEERQLIMNQTAKHTVDTKRETTIQDQHKSKRRRQYFRQRKRKNNQLSSSISSDSSSDDDELLALLKLRHGNSKWKKDLNRIINSSDSNNSEESDTPFVGNRSRKTIDSPSSSSSSSGSENELILAHLAKFRASSSRRRRNRRSLRYGKQQHSGMIKRFRLPENRDMGTGLSSLENIELSTETRMDENENQNNKSRAAMLPATRAVAAQNHVSLQDIGDQDLSPARTQQDNDKSLDLNSLESVREDNSVESDDTLTGTGEKVSPVGPDHLDDFIQPLDDFIQPEGRDVAENLPGDTIDRTASISFGDLPAFFDDMATKLEDDLLPDAKIRFAEFEKRLKGKLSWNASEDHDKLIAAEKEGYELFNEIRRLLIREGTDQCQSALHRLMDRRQRRLHKAKVNKDMWKQFRETAMDLRDIRLQQLCDNVEQLCQNVKQNIENYGPQIDQFHESTSIEGSSDSTMSGDDDDANGLTATESPPYKTGDMGTKWSLPDFDPHMHATRVKRGTKNKNKRNKRASSRSKKRKKLIRDGHKVIQERSSCTRENRKTSNEEGRNTRNYNVDQSETQMIKDASHIHLDADDSSRSSITDNDKPVHVPPLETLFESSRKKTQTAAYDSFATNENDSHRRHNPVSINERMQAFLDANSSSIDGHAAFKTLSTGYSPRRNSSSSKQQDPMRQTSHSLSSNSTRELGNRTSISKYRGRHRRAKATEEQLNHNFDDNSDPDNIRSNSTSQTDISGRSLYQQLLNKTVDDAAERDKGSTYGTKSVGDICRALAENYPESPPLCWRAFKEIKYHFNNENEEYKADASKIFETIWNILREHGVHTLPAMLFSDEPGLPDHIQFLIETLGLIEQNFHCCLKPADAHLYNLFASKPTCAFVELITLQLLDIAYSQVLPKAWSLKAGGRKNILTKLSPLRDALAKVTPLVETVSRLVITRLECQKWCDTDSGLSSFVSSVDPEDFSAALNSGSMPEQSVNKVRFSLFKGAPPRCEIEALWLILAYFAGGVNSVIESKTIYHWRLVTALLHSKAGVLSDDAVSPSSDAEKQNYPHPEHISSCEAELDHVALLLSVGVMKPLPAVDGIVAKIVQKSHEVQVDAAAFSDVSSSLFVACDSSHNDVYEAMKIWDFTNLSTPLPTALLQETLVPTDMLYPVSLSVDNNDVRKMYSLAPSSSLIFRYIALVTSWAGQLPQKKARWSRLNTSILKVISDFDMKAQCGLGKKEIKKGDLEDIPSENTFGQAFSVSESSCAVTTPFSPKSVLYREGSAHLRIALAISRIMVYGPVQVHSVSTGLTKNFREDVWLCLSNDLMQQRLERVLRSSNESAPIELFDGHSSQLYVSAKAMTVVTLLHLGLLPKDLDSPRRIESCSTLLLTGVVIDDDMFLFLISTIVACLHCACDLFEKEIRNKNNIQSSSFSASSDNGLAEVARVVSCISSWLSQVLTRCRIVLGLAVPPRSQMFTKFYKPLKDVGEKILTLTLNPLLRALQCVTSAVDCGLVGDICFRSCLAAIRGSLCWVAGLSKDDTLAVSSVAPGSEAQDNQPSDDLFGALDDDIFLNLDLGDVQNKSISISDVLVDRAKSILMSCIKLSKPSNRFAIIPTVAHSVAEREIEMSIQGRSLAARHIGGVCSCLAALCTIEPKGGKIDQVWVDQLLMPLEPFCGSTDSVRADFLYSRQVAQCFCSEVCELANKFPSCESLVREKVKECLGHCIDALLDSTTLERFPSANLKRVKTNGGHRSEHRESLRLALANEAFQEETGTRGLAGEDCLDAEAQGLRQKKGEFSDTPGPVYNSTNLWKFCRHLGNLCSRFSERDPSIPVLAAVGRILRSTDFDLREAPLENLTTISMEREFLKRFKKLRGIISASALLHDGSVSNLCQNNMINYEWISACVLSSVSTQLLCVAEGFCYYERLLEDRRHTNEGLSETKDNHKFAKLFELQNSYANLSVSLMSWILRESGSCHSDMFTDLMRKIRDSLFSKVLQSQTNEVASCLDEINRASIKVTRLSDTAHTSATGRLSISFSRLSINALRHAIIGRSRELIIHVSKGYSQSGPVHTLSLYNALMNASTSTTTTEDSCFFLDDPDYSCKIIGTALYSAKNSTSHPIHANKCHFQDALDDYLTFIQESRAMIVEEAKAVESLRQLAVNRFLLLKLHHAGTEVSKKKAIILVFKQLLVCEKRFHGEERVDVGASFGTFGPLVACKLAKGLASCLTECIEDVIVSDGMIRDVFECALHLLNISVALSDANPRGSQGSLLSWSRKKKMPISFLQTRLFSNDMSDRFYAAFFFSFCVWLKEVATVISSQSTQDLANLHIFRQEAYKLKSQEKSIWTTATITSTSSNMNCGAIKKMVETSLSLHEIKQLVLLDEKENNGPVANVYAKSKKRSSNDTCSKSGMNSPESFWTPVSSVRRSSKEFLANFIIAS